MAGRNQILTKLTQHISYLCSVLSLHADDYNCSWKAASYLCAPTNGIRLMIYIFIGTEMRVGGWDPGGETLLTNVGASKVDLLVVFQTFRLH